MFLFFSRCYLTFVLEDKSIDVNLFILAMIINHLPKER